MTLSTWIKHPITSFKQWRAKKKNLKTDDVKEIWPPLREFVYLDEVSLHSLLVSQTSTVPYEISHAMSLANEAEVSGTAGASATAGPQMLGVSTQSSITGRYQTSNSNSTQSSRKAVVQTLFKELSELPLEFKFSPQNNPSQAFQSIQSLCEVIEPGYSEPAEDLTRGTLVEIEVRLSVDPVYKLSTMMAEYTAMADEFPGMFQEHGHLNFLHESQPLLKVLDQFLAGLIPIKATAVDHVVVDINEQEYVVHREAVKDLGVETKPLHIVGVTEQVGYWKDTRRVLFSDAKFTVLCRIAKDGLQTIWSPVKLADLFTDVAPDFMHQINAVRLPSATEEGSTAQRPVSTTPLTEALQHYKTLLVGSLPVATETSGTKFRALQAQAATGPVDAISQRELFDAVRDMVVNELNVTKPSPDEDLEYRQSARDKAGLALFPSRNIEANNSHSDHTSTRKNDLSGDEESPERLLDTEVIAIYW